MQWTKTAARYSSAAIIWFALGSFAGAAELPQAQPEDVGLSSPHLARIGARIEADVARADYPGAVLLVARHGKIAYLRGFGTLGPDRETAMPADAIFRVYSMSKAITSVAAMTLVEDGRISLDDPVSKYLPQFKDMRVVAEGAPLDETEPAAWPTVPLVSQITIQDLMRHSSGLAYGFLYRTPVQKLYAKTDLWNDDLSNADFVNRISKLPLARQPGTAWEYSYATDVLGRLIEVVSGKTLFEFETERILEPLGMRDTGFHVANKEKQARISEPFPADSRFGRGGGAIRFSDPRRAKKAESGGAGMVSTAPDYARFLQMMLNGGSLDGRRILSPKTVAFMTADHMSGDMAPLPFPGYSWSLAFAVRRVAGVSAMPGSVGDYFWFSAGGGSYWVDPQEDMLVVFMVNKPAVMEQYQELMRQMVYAAIIR